MKSLRIARYSLLAAAVVGGVAVSSTAAAEVSATASISNVYLWRGQNLGGGQPVVAGSLDYKHDSGLFAGVWGSSAGGLAGTTNDQEVDLYAGYAGKAGDLEYTAAYYYYAYPAPLANSAGLDFKEIYLSAGMSGFKGEGYFGIGDAGWGDNGDMYFALSYTMDKFTGKIGLNDGDAPTTGVPAGGQYVHVDATYAYNSNLAFTVSKVVDADTGPKGQPVFQVSYAIPLK